MIDLTAPKGAASNVELHFGKNIELFDILERQEPGAGNEVQLTDSLAQMIGRGPFHGYRFEGTRFDCGDRAGFFEANVAFALRHATVGDAAQEIIRRYAAAIDDEAAA